MEPSKRTRRNSDQLLTDTITELYTKIQAKITKIHEDKMDVDAIFLALRPLREIEDEYILKGK